MMLQTRDGLPNGGNMRHIFLMFVILLGGLRSSAEKCDRRAVIRRGAYIVHQGRRSKESRIASTDMFRKHNESWRRWKEMASTKCIKRDTQMLEALGLQL